MTTSTISHADGLTPEDHEPGEHASPVAPIYSVKQGREDGAPYAVAPNSQLRNPKHHPPPLGTEVLYVHQGKRIVKGIVRSGDFCAAWMPLPKLPDWVHENIEEYEAEKRRGREGAVDDSSPSKIEDF